MTALSSVTLGDEAGCKLTWDGSLRWKRPVRRRILTPFTLYGKGFTLADETMNLQQDRDKAITATRSSRRSRRSQDARRSTWTTAASSRELGNDRMQQIRVVPDIDVVWRIWFGTYYSVAPTRSASSPRPSVGGILYDEEVDKLKYC